MPPNPAADDPGCLIEWEQLARAETHPLRVAILEMFALDGGRTLSPKELTFELQEQLTTVNYHTTSLFRSGLLRLAHERQVGGSMEHFYCLTNHSAEDLFDRL